MDSSAGTDDDLPPPFPRNHHPQIHTIEQDAYYHLLRAFKAQSDAITWEKEGLITQLRKELSVSDDQHRLLLSKVNIDVSILTIRDWRKANALTSSHSIHQSLPTPTLSVTRKKHKTGHSTGSLSATAPPPAVFKQAPPTGGRPKISKGMPYPLTTHSGRPLNANHGSSFGASEPAEAANLNPLVGRKVWTRWPDDKNFYEVVITDFKEGRHALVYDINTPTETWEWVDLKEISPQDIKWESEGPGVSQSEKKKPLVRGGGVGSGGRGRSTLKGPRKDHLLAQNSVKRKGSTDIELLHTDTLIKEVEKVFSGSHPDPTVVEKAKKVLKEHQQALIEAVATIEDASHGESDEGDRPFPHEHLMDQELGWRKVTTIGRDAW